MRNPRLAADVAYGKTEGSKVVLYGDGKHSKEFAEFYPEGKIECVIKDVSTDSGFTRENFSIPLADIKDIGDIDFDHIILLGYWNSGSIKKFCSEYGISPEKVFLPYKEEKMLTAAREYLNITTFHGTGKPVLCLVLMDDRRDFITVASDTLSKYFDLVKIYITGSNVYYKNEHFASVFCAHRSIIEIKRMIDSIKPDILVCFHAGPHDNVFVYDLMAEYREKLCFVHSTTDFCLNGSFDLSFENISEWLGCDVGTVEMLDYLEREITLAADGVITNCGGEYASKHMLKDAKTCHITDYFQEPDSFTFSDTLPERSYKVCYTGNIAYSHEKAMHQVATLDRVFQDICSQGIEVHLFNFSGNRFRPPYDHLETEKNFYWEDFVSGFDLPSAIKDYDFGLNLLNINEEYKRICRVHFNSLFQAKMVTYLAAGLPMIVNDEFVTHREFVNDNKIGFSVRYDEIPLIAEKIKKVDYRQLKENVRKLQGKYLAEKKDEKLAKYLLSLIKPV
ncbi:MAG: hypothetical protein AB7F25_09800 [Deferribacterales bacterium]